ncbi:hypothetical protein RRG08_058019 [Elysia crispata]|uniref:Uncharacterized protein n=1 Tax=Elysia crispata TaxID=231223 RepID=A0AAE1ARY1_9GAST|nr:hypothetical protein RRG08_058019 [Elysia crispata]
MVRRAPLLFRGNLFKRLRGVRGRYHSAYITTLLPTIKGRHTYVETTLDLLVIEHPNEASDGTLRGLARNGAVVLLSDSTLAQEFPATKVKNLVFATRVGILCLDGSVASSERIPETAPVL